MKRILAILDNDREYAEELAAYAGEWGLTPFSVIAFTDPESLKNFTLRQSVDLLLDGMGLSDEEIKDIRARQTIRLGEDIRERFPKDKGGFTKEKIPAVFKYQAADRLFGEVMECYKSIEKRSGESDLKSEIIGVASPVGRCGKTGFAITLGRILAENSRVVYLNTEECSGLSELTGTVYRRSLTDLIYALREGTLDESVLGSAIYKLGGLDYVAPVSCAEDMAEIRAEELAELVTHLAAYENAEIIIIDTGNVGMDAFPLLERCGIIYAPVMDDEVSQAKMAEWKEQLLSYGPEDLPERVRIIHLPGPSGIAGAEGHFDKLLYGSVGKMIRDMLREDEDILHERRGYA